MTSFKSVQNKENGRKKSYFRKYANYGIKWLHCHVWFWGQHLQCTEIIWEPYQNISAGYWHSVLKKSNKTCNAQHTTTKSGPSLYSISAEKEIDICRIECSQNRHIILHNVVNADRCQIKKPESQNRGKQEANFACAKSLYAEQQQKHRYRNYHHSICQNKNDS